MDISPTVNGELRYYGSEQLELMQALEMLAQKPGAKLWIRNHVARCVVMLRKWQRDSYEHGITEQKELDQYESEIKVLKLELQKAKTDKQTDRVNDLDRRLEKVPLKNDRVKPPMLWNEVPGSLIWDQMCDADRLAVACGTLVAFFVVHDKRFAKELFFRNPVKSEKSVRRNYTKRTLTVCAVPLALDAALEYFELVSEEFGKRSKTDTGHHDVASETRSRNDSGNAATGNVGPRTSHSDEDDRPTARKVVRRLGGVDAGNSGMAMIWKHVQGQLLAKQDRGEPCSAVRKLARELACSEATIAKAITKSKTLQGWKARSLGPKAAPKASSLSDVVTAERQQTSEPAPDDVLPDDDVDVLMACLIDEAKPEERAILNALDHHGRRRMAVTYQSQCRDREPSPLVPNNPHQRTLNVKQHKRV